VDGDELGFSIRCYTQMKKQTHDSASSTKTLFWGCQTFSSFPGISVKSCYGFGGLMYQRSLSFLLFF
jgi:hypothetical protein